MKSVPKVIGQIVLCGMAVLLTACRNAPATIPPAAQAGDLSLDPCTVKIKKQTYQADCGTLIVPENRSDPNSRLISLPVKRIRALSDRSAEPIFYLAGGPGNSNMGFSNVEGLIDNHDIVMVGYRGVDGSVKLACPEFDAALRDSLDGLLNPDALERYAEATADCAARLQAEGVDLDGYTLDAVIDDMEAARVGLGYERINLLSESYGTRLAQLYAWLYPDSLHRSVMIGVNPPGRFLFSPEMIDAQIAYYASLCASDPACSSRTNDLAETMRQVNQNMPERWLLTSIDPDQVKFMSFLMLYHRNSSMVVFDAYLDAAEGNPAGLAFLSAAMSLVIKYNLLPITWGDQFVKALSADRDVLTNASIDLNPPDSIMGSPFSAIHMAAAASNWPITPMPEDYRQVHPSDVETLLVSGNIDFSTPAAYATEQLLPYLNNGQQAILSEFGHVADVWNTQPEATVYLLTTFYDTGAVDDSLFTYQPVDFKVKLGFSAMYKLGLGAIIALVAGLALLVRSIVRRVRRRRAVHSS